MDDLPDDYDFKVWFASVYTEPVPEFYKTIARMAWEAGYDVGANDGYRDGYEDRYKDMGFD